MKKQNRGFIALGIFAVAYIIISIAIPFIKNGVFWVNFAFSIVAIGLMGLIIAKYPLGSNARSRFYGFPLIRIAITYLIVQIAVSYVFMALAKFAPVRLSVVTDVLILAVSSIGFISADAMRDEIERQDVAIKKDVSLMRALQSKTRMLVGQCDDKDVAAELKKFAEEMQYSDPVTNDNLTEIEADLSALIDEMQKAVVEADYCAASDICKKASVVLAERNRLCKLGK